MTIFYKYQESIKPHRILLHVLLLFAVNSANAHETSDVQEPLVRPLHIEPVKSVMVENGEIAFTVKSNGCTSLKHLRLFLDDTTVFVVRTKPDRCRKKTTWQTFRLPLSSKDTEWREVFIGNPLALE